MNNHNTELQTEPPGPIVIITGCSGNIGAALIAALQDQYTIIGFDVREPPDADDFFDCDITSPASLELAVRQLRERWGGEIAAVIHLAAYFDFTGEENPAYEAVNEEGTKNLLTALQPLEVERFVYSGTMLVHEAGVPGERIDERTPINPQWAYPKSKARVEDIIREHRGKTPATLLRIAGLYDDETAVPTLSHQIARIYERTIKSRFYSGDLKAGQAFVHRDDLVNAFKQVVAKRADLPEEHALLIGEPEAVSYQRLQDAIGELIHGEKSWATLRAPAAAAKAAAFVELQSEPVVPDDLDRGEKPFIRPFMVDMASEHYALDISRARDALDWSPQRNILHSLPHLIENLKDDPAGWYRANGISAPRWMEVAEKRDVEPDALRKDWEQERDRQHRAFLWAPFFTMFAGTWLVCAPLMLGYEGVGLAWSDAISGALVIVLGALTLSIRFAMLRWAVAGLGVWVMFSPLVFWTPSAAAYLNGTLVGALIFGFAVLARPPPGVSRIATELGPEIPPGWEFNPSAWLQRLPIIILAVVGFQISRYMAAYQLGHIESVWEPFFAGAPANPKNGTEEIITSSVSEAWPIPDAGLGALTYMLEILTGVVGSTRRWRTMPWLVLLFGVMIVPLGIVSITFIIIQPIVIGTWCTLCIIAAAAMLIQIPYSLDELIATGDFLWRKKKAGAPVLRILFTGDSDDGEREEKNRGEFEQPLGYMAKDFFAGGLSAPWNLFASIGVGVWLMFTRITLDAEGGMANADHLTGSLVVTISVIALAETARPARFLNLALGVALLVTPFAYGVGATQIVASLAAGLLLIGLSLPRGRIQNQYGAWSKLLI